MRLAVMENGTPPPYTLLCGRCATACDPEDNFCRHCGLALNYPQLPVISNGRHLPTVWQPPVPVAVVKGAAFVAAGTIAEILVRRMVRGAFGRGPRTSRAPARRRLAVAEADDSLPDDTQVVSETVLFRRIRFRR
jgi:hypothetical protein